MFEGTLWPMSQPDLNIPSRSIHRIHRHFSRVPWPKFVGEKKSRFFGPHSTLILPLNNPLLKKKFLNHKCSWEYYLRLEFKNSFDISVSFYFLWWPWRKKAEFMWTADLPMCVFSLHILIHQLPVVVCAEIGLLRNRDSPILIKTILNVYLLIVE